MLTFFVGLGVGAAVAFPAGMISMARYVRRNDPLEKERAHMVAQAEKANEARLMYEEAARKADHERLKRQFGVPRPPSLITRIGQN